MFANNKQKFLELKKFALPLDQYAITGSGPLGIRNLREIGDIDIIVDSKLWEVLATKYGVTDENGVRRIVFPGGLVEAMGEDSFYSQLSDKTLPTVADRIAKAEMIDGLPFEPIDYVLYYKRKMARKKDLEDILIIETWLKNQH